MVINLSSYLLPTTNSLLVSDRVYQMGIISLLVIKRAPNSDYAGEVMTNLIIWSMVSTGPFHMGSGPFSDKKMWAPCSSFDKDKLVLEKLVTNLTTLVTHKWRTPPKNALEKIKSFSKNSIVCRRSCSQYLDFLNIPEK